MGQLQDILNVLLAADSPSVYNTPVQNVYIIKNTHQNKMHVEVILHTLTVKLFMKSIMKFVSVRRGEFLMHSSALTASGSVQFALHSSALTYTLSPATCFWAKLDQVKGRRVYPHCLFTHRFFPFAINLPIPLSFSAARAN